MTTYTETSLKENIEQFFICKDKDGLLVSDKDCRKSEWIDILDMGRVNSKEYINTLDIGFLFVPEFIQSIDFYVCNINNENLNDLFLVFQDSKYENQIVKRFGYSYEEKEFAITLFLGTFCRVSDGWKFYPKFESFHKNINEIFKNYKRRNNL